MEQPTTLQGKPKICHINIRSVCPFDPMFRIGNKWVGYNSNTEPLFELMTQI